MPYLTLDDATQFFGQRLQQFGDGVLQSLTTPPVDPNVVQRLQDYGQAQLQNLSQVGVGLPQPPQIDSSVLQRLQDFGSQHLQDLAQQAQQPPPTIQQASQVPQQPGTPGGPPGAPSGLSDAADEAQRRLDDLDAAIRAIGPEFRDQALQNIEQFRAAQAANAPPPPSWTEPVARGLGAAMDVLEQRRLDDIDRQARFGQA